MHTDEEVISKRDVRIHYNYYTSHIQYRSVPKSFKCHLINHTRPTNLFHFLMPNLCLGTRLPYIIYTVRAGEVRNFVDFRQTFHGTTTTMALLLLHCSIYMSWEICFVPCSYKHSFNSVKHTCYILEIEVHQSQDWSAFVCNYYLQLANSLMKTNDKLVCRACSNFCISAGKGLIKKRTEQIAQLALYLYACVLHKRSYNYIVI